MEALILTRPRASEEEISRKENRLMPLAERLLLAISRQPGNQNGCLSCKEETIDSALEFLRHAFKNFEREIAGKRVLDFGCGYGQQTVAMAKSGAKYVVGLDINQKFLQRGRDLAAQHGLNGHVEFADKLEERRRGSFDLVISQNSMEHFVRPVEVLEIMKAALNPAGKLLITFGPPWFAPYGSHMQFMTRVPWINLLFDETTVMNVRNRFRRDGAMRYEDVEGGLAKMSVAKFERLVSQCGMKIHYKKYDCIKGLDFLGRLPVLRELFINHVNCALVAG
jgi:SAM-dependent methyltransferase